MPFASFSLVTSRRKRIIGGTVIAASAVVALGYAARAQQAAPPPVTVPSPAEVTKTSTDASGNITRQTIHSNGMITIETTIAPKAGEASHAPRIVRQTVTGNGWVLNEKAGFDTTGKRKASVYQLITGADIVVNNDENVTTGSGVRIAPNGTITRPDGITVRADGTIVNRRGKVLVTAPAAKKP